MQTSTLRQKIVVFTGAGISKESGLDKPIDNHLMSVLHMLSIKNRKRLDITKREDL